VAGLGDSGRPRHGRSSPARLAVWATGGRRRTGRAVRTVMVPCSRQGPYRDTPHRPGGSRYRPGADGRQIKRRTPRSVVTRVKPPVRDGAKILTVVSGGHGPVGLEFVDGAFDNVALSVDVGVECRWPPTLVAPSQPVSLLVGRLRDGRLDPTFPQVVADRPAGVGLVTQHPAGSGSWPAGSAAADPDSGHHRPQPEAVVALPGTGDSGDRPTPSVSGQVNLARQPAPGPADGFPARPARAARRLPTGRVGFLGWFLVI
jgi:hypothetical protein